MTFSNRRMIGVLVVLLTTQVFCACNAGQPVAPAKSGDAAQAAPAKETAGAENAAAAAAVAEAGAAVLGTAPEAATTATAAATAAPEPSAAPTSPCVSSQCHTKLLSGSEVHPPADGCDSCHEEVSKPHPVKGKKTFKLTQEMPDLCYTCHDAFGKAKTVHPPVEAGMCTECHNPHSAGLSKLLNKPIGELCKSCHEDHTNFKVLHGPVSNGDCTACHVPHESNTPTLLQKEGAELCEGCHVDFEDILKKKTVHAAVEAGCTSCHNPHGSKNEKMLSDPVPNLCFTCHADIEETVKNATSPHPAIDTPESCVACHSPHASDQDALMIKVQKDVCLGCHDTHPSAKMPVLHGPNNDGKCSRCHNPHGSKNEKLLVREFPEEAYVPYTDKAFPLCFGCHKRDLLQYPQTSFATGFRDGEKNLHYVHVNNEQKGRSCRLCHALHGSTKPNLIADNIEFGQWKMQLKYVKTDTGGGCSPGCHNPKYYDRQSPGRKPANVK